MDLFNPPKDFDYMKTIHELDIDKLENPYIRVIWEDSVENITKERLNRIKNYFEKKYNSKNVNIVTKLKTVENNIQSVDISMDVLDENFQSGIIKKYLEANEYDDSETEVEKKFFELDKIVNSEISENKIDVTPFKKWYIKSIKFSNFLSFGDGQILDFEKINGIAAVESNPPNFGGKTVLTVDLLLFLFFNTTTKTSKAEEVFNRYRDKNKVTVEGEIQIDGEDYIIVREVLKKPKRSGGYTVSTSLDFFKKLTDGTLVNFTGEQRRETEKFIKDSIGDMSDFLMTILTTGSNLEELIDSKPTARGQIISRFLGLDALKLKEEKAKELYSNFSKSMISNHYNIEGLNNDIETYKENIEDQNGLIEKKKEEFEDVEHRIVKGNDYRDEIVTKKHTDIDEELLIVKPEKLTSDIQDYANKISTLKTQIDNVEVIEPSEFYNESEHDTIKDEVSRLTTELTKAKTKKESNEAQLNKLGGGKECQYCGIELATTEYSDNLRKEIDNLNMTISHTQIELDGRIAKDNEYKKLKEEFDRYEKNKLIKGNFELQIESHELKKKDAEDKLRRFELVQQKIEENKKIDDLLNKANIRLKDLSNERDAIKYAIQNAENHIKSYKEKIKINRERISKIREEFQKERIYKIYLEVFGKNGISKMIMRDMTPVINSELQRILSDTTEFGLEVRVSKKDEVEFWMIDNNTQIEKLLSTGSGYEKTIASLALRSVLSKVCSLPKPNIIVFDEVFGKISNENLDRVSEFFDKIKDYFDKIFVITHNPLVSQWADTVIKVEKNDNISEVKQ